ncbi:hypothetical protein MNBD_GAMMA10-1018 [hydrothermal vent metagenome]|uniref:Transmembrane protein n=1 Tax=hydrothermal vent metagenome TaxID=652676 RepID=A0A3B0XZN4_9ZZZZ
MPEKDKWAVSVFRSSPIIRQLSPLTQFFKHFTAWPEIADYSQLFRKQLMDITPVAQAENATEFEDQYEPRVYLKKQLQTRTHNWHDFFNAMIWLRFSETKKTLNQLHYFKASQRSKGSNRTRLESKITQFDECGAILICNNPHLLDLVKKHDWHTLFIDNAAAFEADFRCIIFGHAIYEKALNPYIGLTCHCLMIADENMLEEVKSDDYTELDKYLSQLWQQQKTQESIKFQPFPMLGIPGYWPEQNLAFYQNTAYFRPVSKSLVKPPG